MKKILIALAIAAPLAFASVADAGSPTAKRANKCAKAKAAGKACTLEFKIQNVKGNRASGDGDSIFARLQAQFGNLIHFRTQFNDKVVRAADGI